MRFSWGIAWFLLLAACTRPDDNLVETRHGTSLPSVISPELSVIDSLMWQQPDSALMRLLPYFDTCRDVSRNVSTSAEYNRHYAHLLLAELLYKNDYALTNRAELLRAVDYFDSLVDTHGADTHGMSLRRYNRRDASHTSATMPQSIAFLDARAHYINGVGYYENDSVVKACGEYLKALKTMENHFDVEMVCTPSLPIPHIPRFMAYIYNRLGDLFSEQFMMEPSISCYENSLVFSKIESTSLQCISVLLYRIGNEYDKMGEISKARQYYEQALEKIPCSNNLSYRDLVTLIALSDYQLGYGMEQPIQTLREIARQTDDESEKLARFLTIGDIFFEEGLLDSALFYLEPVFGYSNRVLSQIQAAEYLQIIYDSIGDDKKSDECIRFLAQQKKTEGENKALVSQLDDLFQLHMTKKQEKQAKKEQKKTIVETIGIIVPITVVVALTVVFLVKHKGRKKMEAERQSHHTKQAALSGRLKRSNQEVRVLKDQIKQQHVLIKTNESAETFTDEPVCRLIMERVNEGQFKSKVDYMYYKRYALDKQQLLALRVAADCHFEQFTVRLKKAYPELTHGDLDYCCLYLLGLSDADVAALMQRAYNTVSERNGKIRRILGNDNPLPFTLIGIAEDSSFL